MGFLDEQLRPGAWPGVALTVIGVVIVGFEKERTADLDKEKAENETPDADTEPEDEESPATSDLDTDPNDSETESDRDATTAEEDSLDAEEKELLVVSTKSDGSKKSPCPDLTKKQLRVGYLLQTVNVVLDAYGFLLVKQHGVGMTTWEINLVRFGFAGAVLFLFSGLLCPYEYSFRETSLVSKTERGEEDDGKAETRAWYKLPVMSRLNWAKVSLAVVLVTFLTPAQSNYSVFQIALALAMTLGSVGPIYSLPLSWLILKQRVSLLSCVGAVLAVVGVAILAFFGTIEE